MGKAEEMREEQRKAEQADPVIVAGLREDTDRLVLAREIADEFELDERTAYRWVTITEERFDRSRRRIAGIGIALLVVGFVLAGAGVILRILESGVLERPIMLGLVIGLPVAAAGLALGLASRKLARS